MPNKPIGKGFKIITVLVLLLLCIFQVHHGQPVDVFTGKKTFEKGLAK